jgi:signal transduction histidine kinase
LRQPKRWIDALWVWWALSFLCLFVLWGLALVSRSLSILDTREVAMVSHVRDLSQAFAAMQKLQAELLSSLDQDARKGRLTLPRLELIRSQGRPYFHIYRLGPESPSWVGPLVRPRLGTGPVVVRPEPPGFEAGRVSVEPPGTPEDYLLVCSRTPDGGVLVSEMDLNYVYRTWLPNQLERFGFGTDLSQRRLSSDELWTAPAPAPPRPVEGLQSLLGSRTWRWRINTFFADDPHPFGAVELRLDNAHALATNLALHLLALTGGVLLMLSFALSLRLAALGMRRELEFAEARSRFTAMVSHELRTPVAAVKMYAEILQNHLVDDPAKIAEYHQIIGTQAARLESMVESLLEVGALERGSRSFRLEATDLNELVRSAAGECELDLGDLPLARIDRQATLQVVLNLVQNAQKYGRPPVRVSSRDGAQLTVEVSDCGPGIPVEHRERIFEAYHRLGRDESAKGVGLGLAVVKGFIEGQGGTIRVGERPGGGAAFTITLQKEQA